ncbi:GNAT family N-acetyltransferase [Vogesella sp. DC21W]|uniref:GNAT family N-acetyltransferase n=1 Tax=Vogesella aquatica TaxID=2984206 RepID=A0ABT5IW86_9NEIS|nr:GNAT family N-acetyltransferase [Vogesella aquatica]MDC7715879.1 GNAT family N-acetyltransferase [Vogesella aquatica]
MTILPYAPHQHAALAQLYLDTRRSCFPWLDGQAMQLGDFARDTADESLLVAQDAHGQVLGFAGVYEKENFLHHLYVAPAAQGQGIGQALLQAAALRFTATPSLKCFAANPRALAFYRQQGWQPAGEGVDAAGHRWLRLQGPQPGLVFSTDCARLDRELVYHYLSRESYWAAGLPRDIFEASLQGSLVIGGYNADGQQLAFARVITDYATFGYLADVFVVDSARGQGIAKALMRYIQLHPRLQNLRRFMLATADAHGLYAQFGFGALGKPERIMEKVEPAIYQRLAAERGQA